MKEEKKHYIYVEVPKATKTMAKRKAKKQDLSLRQWITKVIKGAE
jgi:predicted HicB family RNase H-like nuclease